MLEHSLIFDNGLSIGFPDEGENWVMLDGG